MAAVQAMRNLATRRAFSAWQEKTGRAMRRKALLTTAVQRFRAVTLHAAVTAWSQVSARKSAHRRKLALALEVGNKMARPS